MVLDVILAVLLSCVKGQLELLILLSSLLLMNSLGLGIFNDCKKSKRVDNRIKHTLIHQRPVR